MVCVFVVWSVYGLCMIGVLCLYGVRNVLYMVCVLLCMCVFLYCLCMLCVCFFCVWFVYGFVYGVLYCVCNALFKFSV